MQTYERSARSRSFMPTSTASAAPDELAELGWEEAAEDALVLVEWPERAGFALDRRAARRRAAARPSRRRARRAHRQPRRATGAWRPATRARAGAARPARERRLGAMPTRVHLQGDASTRAYERLVKPIGETAILMISPPRPDGPPVRLRQALQRDRQAGRERPRLRRPWTDGLRALGSQRARDPRAGSGGRAAADRGSRRRSRHRRATARSPSATRRRRRLLAEAARRDLPTVLPVAEGRDHAMPPYDHRGAARSRSSSLLDWYVPHVARA